MSITTLRLNPATIGRRWVDAAGNYVQSTWHEERPTGGWRYRFEDAELTVVATTRSDGVPTATVIFEGLPVLVVVAEDDACDRDLLPERRLGYRHMLCEYLEPQDVKQMLAFMVDPVGELGVAQLSTKESCQRIVEAVDEGMTRHTVHDEFGQGQRVLYDAVDKIYEEQDGEGHEFVAFIGVIVHALHEAFPNDTPEPRGF